MDKTAQKSTFHLALCKTAEEIQDDCSRVHCMNTNQTDNEMRNNKN